MIERYDLDYTLRKYTKLCDAISESKYKAITIGEYLNKGSLNKNFIILRHDVDRRPEIALRIALIENKFNIKASYYFRTNKNVFNPAIIKKIKNLGHEIGYHYEVLDKAKGDMDKALKLFAGELIEFRKICDVDTICMHGNPLTKWDNRNLWTTYSFKDYGIMGEAYLSLDFNNIAYYTDTGRNWNQKYSIKDHITMVTSTNFPCINTTNELIDLIKECKIANLCILTHPERWATTAPEYILSASEDLAKNSVKYLYKKVKA